MFEVIDREFDEIAPREQLLSTVYNFDSGICTDEDRVFRSRLNASVKRAAYTFDKATKSTLRKRIV